MSGQIFVNGKNKTIWFRKWGKNKTMVANIENWLFRLADNKECEPEIEKDGSISCEKCENVTCEYYDDYNEEVKNVEHRRDK